MNDRAITPGSGWDAHVHVFDEREPVLAGHYRPAHRPLQAIEAEALAHGIGHLVLVQPSVYGTDNGQLLRALAAGAGRHRGVVVLGDDIGDVGGATLDAWHALGVRGARLNRISPVGETADVSMRFERLAPLLSARGWHLQWYAGPRHLAEIAALHDDAGAPTCVLDHLAGIHAGVHDEDPAWQALARLAARGAWIKLSGWYRLQAVEPYKALWPAMQRVSRMFGDRMVWGSDWPHTSFPADQPPRYASTWEPVVAALGAEVAEGLLARPPAIYR